MTLSSQQALSICLSLSPLGCTVEVLKTKSGQHILLELAAYGEQGMKLWKEEEV